MNCTRETAWVGSALLLILAVVGCDRRAVTEPIDTATLAISHKVEEGSVAATVTLRPRQVRTSGAVQFTIEVTAPAEALMEPPDLDAALPQDWVITDRRRTTPSANEIQRTERFEYTIEPYLPGRHEIRSFEIVCDVEGDAGGRTVLHSIAVPVDVVSEWPAGETSAEPAALRSVVDPRPAPLPWWAWTGIGGGAVLLAALVAWLAARSRRPHTPEPIRKKAHEIALADLGRLIADQLIERGAFKPFYQRISNILRRYIEDRYALRAPEQTTEEFLDASRTARCFDSGDLQLLEEFLTHCDMVKFAEHVPDHTQMTSTLDTVRAFIERTRSEDAIVELPPTAGARADGGGKPAEVMA